MNIEQQITEIVSSLLRSSRDINYLHGEVMKRVSGVTSVNVRAIIIKQFGATLP